MGVDTGDASPRPRVFAKAPLAVGADPFDPTPILFADRFAAAAAMPAETLAAPPAASVEPATPEVEHPFEPALDPAEVEQPFEPALGPATPEVEQPFEPALEPMFGRREPVLERLPAFDEAGPEREDPAEADTVHGPFSLGERLAGEVGQTPSAFEEPWPAGDEPETPEVRATDRRSRGSSRRIPVVLASALVAAVAATAYFAFDVPAVQRIVADALATSTVAPASLQTVTRQDPVTSASTATANEPSERAPASSTPVMGTSPNPSPQSSSTASRESPTNPTAPTSPGIGTNAGSQPSSSPSTPATSASAPTRPRAEHETTPNVTSTQAPHEASATTPNARPAERAQGTHRSNDAAERTASRATQREGRSRTRGSSKDAQETERLIERDLGPFVRQ
jgi:hypothetical protein